MNRTSIPWVKSPDGSQGYTWNCVVGCSPASTGCKNCYAARLAATRLAHLSEYKGLAYPNEVVWGPRYQWTNDVRFLPHRLTEPMRRRKPAGIFVCDMGDLFHERVTNEQIAAVYGVMASCPQHRFYVCTKRAKRRREWFAWFAGTMSDPNRVSDIDGRLRGRWPIPNVVELTSIEDQATADERIPDALATPAAVRGLSIEPLLESFDIEDSVDCAGPCGRGFHNFYIGAGLDWVLVGGESGPNARPCHVDWIRSIVRQCKDAEVPVFVKQIHVDGRCTADVDSFPSDLRLRGFPAPAPTWPSGPKI